MDWRESQQRKLEFLVDLIGGEFNLIRIFDSDDDFCSAVKHEIVGKNLLECSTADLPMVEEWIEFFDEAAEDWDEAGMEDEEADRCLLEGDAQTMNSVCYADCIEYQIHRNSADAMAAYEGRLDEMVERCG